jgi:hypothetical protein
MIELLFFLLMVFTVAVISRRIDKLIVSTRMIFMVSGILIGWFVTGFINVTAPPVSTN